MKKQNLQLNRRLTIKKKLITTLTSSEMGAIQGGLPNTLLFYGCLQSNACSPGNSDDGPCMSIGDACQSANATLCVGHCA